MSLRVPPELVEPEEEADLLPVRPDHRHGQDDEGKARHEGYLAAFLRVCHGLPVIDLTVAD